MSEFKLISGLTNDVLSAYSERPYTVKVRDPLGNPTSIEVDVYGPDSNTAKKKVDEIIQEHNKSDDDSSGSLGAKIVAAYIADWRNIAINEPGDFPHTFENAVWLMDNVDWIFQPVHEERQKRENFMLRQETN